MPDRGYQVKTDGLLTLADRLGPLGWVHRSLPALPRGGSVPGLGELAAAFDVVFEWLASQEKNDRRSITEMSGQLRQAAQAVTNWDRELSKIDPTRRVGKSRSGSVGQLVK